MEFRYLSYQEANPEAAQQQEQNRDDNKSEGGGSAKKTGRPSLDDLLPKYSRCTTATPAQIISTHIRK
jgi:hypothetical protein